MPLIVLTAPSVCNRCRKALHVDERVYQGERTKQHWCEPCRGEVGLDGLPPVVVTKMDALADGLAALKAKRRVVDISARMLGERE